MAPHTPPTKPEEGGGPKGYRRQRQLEKGRHGPARGVTNSASDQHQGAGTSSPTSIHKAHRPKGVPFGSKALGMGSSRKYARDQPRGSGSSTTGGPQPLAQHLPLTPTPGAQCRLFKSPTWAGGGTSRQTEEQGRCQEGKRANGVW